MATMALGSKGEAFQLEGQTWVCKNELPSDIIINIGEVSFHLHKFPLLRRSGLLQNMINDHQSEDGKGCILQLHDLPGGPKAFEHVAKFCYDVKFELNTLNVVSVRCAAEHLVMTETYLEENLIKQTEHFITEVFEHNWKESLRILETCQSFLPHSEDLQIISRCIDSLAVKAYKPRSPKADWWYEDVSLLSLPLYKRLILAIKSKGMKPEIVSGSLKDYAIKHIPTLNTMQANAISAQSETEQRVIIHELVELLPTEKGVNPTRFLVCLLRAAMILHANPSCWENLEKRVGAQLDEATVEDILIPNLGYTVETLYDVDCFQRIVESFMSVNQPVNDTYSPGIVDEGQYLINSTPSLTPMTMVAKLVDSYLGEVASDVNLKFPKFQALAAVIPSYARPSDDGIYRAIDIYLKSHPWLSDSDREQLCQLMNCQKFSLEACTHAAQNERLPLRVIVQVLFFEQLRLRTTIAGWFFVSDNIDNSNGHSSNICGISKNNNRRMVQSEISEKNGECGDEEMMNMENDDEVKLRIAQLEKECWSLKKDLEKLGKGKGFWRSLCSKFGGRTRQDFNGKQVFMEC
ncbi:uncharacterized protein A4U43_C06F2920 [Asparagus officinalis]|uniref:NPH3 domain-containing protein n=1 Tax=Asparagus officinalis TaxID=4686 RepID=A0A5P1ELA0_ASPOF|nr:uncharacterized protein A4U43_C06F2920 [Asparagus officinalis]